MQYNIRNLNIVANLYEFYLAMKGPKKSYNIKKSFFKKEHL